MKTVDEILREMRCGIIPKHRHDRELLMHFADRFEAAAKALEADRDNWRRQALDEDARANATHKDSLVVGDMAATRKALERLREWVLMDLNENAFIADSSGNYLKLINGTIEIANAALAKPPRNCDVGTAKKQSLRFEDFCNLHRSCEKGCGDCPLLNCEPSCEFEWAHLPYGKGAIHEQK